MLPASGTGLVLVVLRGTLFWSVLWQPVLLGVAGLIAVVGFNLISSRFLPLLWLAGGLKVIQLVRVSPLWPASRVSAVDKSRSSKSVEVGDIWEIYCRCLQLVPIADALAMGNAVVSRDHLAWEIWSAVAERALASAFRRVFHTTNELGSVRRVRELQGLMTS